MYYLSKLKQRPAATTRPARLSKLIVFTRAIIGACLFFSGLSHAAAPVLAPIADQQRDINTGTYVSGTAFDYSVTDSDTPLSGLSISYSSSDTSILRTSGGPPPHIAQVMLFDIMPNASGLVTVTATVSDGTDSSTQSFKVRVGPEPTEAPIISGLQDTVMDYLPGSSRQTAPFSYSVTDPDSALNELSTTVSSSNHDLFIPRSSPPPHIASVALFDLLPNAVGTAELSITVSDGQNSTTKTFTVEVIAKPSIKPINDHLRITNTGTSSIIYPVFYEVTYPGDFSELQLSFNSSNSELLEPGNSPPPDVAQVMLFNLPPNKTGSSLINMEISNGRHSASESFLITIEDNTAPEISPITDQKVQQAQAVSIDFSVSDGQQSSSSLGISVSSSNPSLLSSDDIQIQGSGDQKSLVFKAPHNMIGTTHITISARDTEVSSSQSFKLEVESNSVFNSLVVHDKATLDLLAMPLSTVLNQLGSEMNTSGESLFRSLWDTQNPPERFLSVAAHNCTGSFNGFPYECREADGSQADPSKSSSFINNYHPIALINRYDLRDRKDFKNCGEARIIYAFGDGNDNNGNHGLADDAFDRSLMIFEAQLANPTPGSAEGCKAIVDFWASLPEDDMPQTRANMLRDFYLNGISSANISPVISSGNFVSNSGQIRSNQFRSDNQPGIPNPQGWVLHEFKLNPLSFPKVIPVTVKSNPFGGLFNESDRSSTAVSFRSSFLQEIDSLLLPIDEFFLTVTQDRFNNGQSHASGAINENRYLTQASSGFIADIEAVLQAKNSELTAEQVLNRATAMTCGGCHMPGRFNLTHSDAIGPGQSWPSSSNLDGFVQIDEVLDNNQRYILSPALKEAFLPAREKDFSKAIEEQSLQSTGSSNARTSSGTQSPVNISQSGKRSG
ncbi:hypothetical protein [Agaribacterium haliotis]|uniref:hypothetical protein n=1 Tax=Agaribacterium haliotis TaxID=2013869 RepID=UPI000BB57524|nr:hypothetical protein [Agaribacterium haliotis]